MGALDFFWEVFQVSILKDILTIDNSIGERIYFVGSRKGPVDMMSSCLSNFNKLPICRKMWRWMLS